MKGSVSHTAGLKEIIKKAAQANADTIQSGMNRALFHTSQPVDENFVRPKSQYFDEPHKPVDEMEDVCASGDNPFEEDLSLQRGRRHNMRPLDGEDSELELVL